MIAGTRRGVLLVRHGQASFGEADYDRLSDLGAAQARALGAHLRALGIAPARVLHGRLKRQKGTAEGVFDGLAAPMPAAEIHPGLDEYEPGPILNAFRAATGAAAPPRGDRKEHFRQLSAALLAWQRGEIAGDEPWEDFSARVAASVHAACAPTEGPVLVATSGGVIGEALRQALDAPPATWVKLHMQVKNAGFSLLMPGREGLSVASFNETPHLDMTPDMVSYS